MTDANSKKLNALEGYQTHSNVLCFIWLKLFIRICKSKKLKFHSTTGYEHVNNIIESWFLDYKIKNNEL